MVRDRGSVESFTIADQNANGVRRGLGPGGSGVGAKHRDWVREWTNCTSLII